MPPEKLTDGTKKSRRINWLVVVILPLWVLIGFGAAQIVLVALLFVARLFGVSFKGVDQSVFMSIVAAVVYLFSLAIIIGLPWWIKKYRTTREDIGITRLPSWMDIGLAPAGFIVYFLSSALLVYIVGLIVPNFNLTQAQQIGFSNLSHYYEYVLAFATLVVIAPLSEEILFRGYLYGKLRGKMPLWMAMLLTSALFGLVHGQWNVALDVFALSMVLCSLREITGNIWAGVLLHMLKNSLAFYILFINPGLLHTIGG